MTTGKGKADFSWQADGFKIDPKRHPDVRVPLPNQQTHREVVSEAGHIGFVLERFSKIQEVDKPLFKGRGRKKIFSPVAKGEFRQLLGILFKGLKRMKYQAHKRLIQLTGRDFGTDREAWEKWHEENTDASVYHWRRDGLAEHGFDLTKLTGEELIPELIINLMHKERVVREVCHAMLQEIIGPIRAYDADGPENLIRKQYEGWKAWWNMLGSRGPDF